MEKLRFSKGEAVKFGWDTTKGNLGFYIVVLILYMLLPNIPDIITSVAVPNNPTLEASSSIFSLILSGALMMGFIKINLRFVDNRRPELGELFSCFELLLKYLGATILYVLIVMAGTLLLIVPGIIWAIKFSFYPYIIVDKDLGIIDSFKKSSEITNGVKNDLFVFGFLLGLIVLLGALAFLVGLFAALPTAMLAIAFVYRKLLDQVEGYTKVQRPESKPPPSFSKPEPIEP